MSNNAIGDPEGELCASDVKPLKQQAKFAMSVRSFRIESAPCLSPTHAQGDSAPAQGDNEICDWQPGKNIRVTFGSCTG